MKPAQLIQTATNTFNKMFECTQSYGTPYRF